MSEQYTPIIESAQAYLTTLHQETITRQEQEIGRLRRDLMKADIAIKALSCQVRDLELDITMNEPRQIGQHAPLVLKGFKKTEQVRRLAAARNISISTAWRRVQSGEEKLEN